MPDNDKTLYDVALEVTDDVLGPGTYAELNASHGHPEVQAAIRRAGPLHAAPAVDPTEEWRALVRRGADLCRRDSAGYAQVVRLADHLCSQGLERDEALAQALDFYDSQSGDRASGTP